MTAHEKYGEVMMKTAVKAAFYLDVSTKLEPGSDDVAQAFLEAKLGEQNMSIGDVAGLCGWSRHAFMSQLSAGFPCVPLRWKIEAVLGFRAIWSSAAEVDIRSRCFEAFSVDPRTAALPDVKRLCRKLGVPSPNIRRQDAWVSNLLSWLAVNSPKLNKSN
ncbi:MAG: hypothetical protein NT154_01400 [Verrucomicrobia bacterium]|nr:hypothetical protein [Verrucomicrobiota bacterium]